VKKILVISLILLNGCLPPVIVFTPGFIAGTIDVTVKSKELSGDPCKWRCYKNKKK
jgi:hypothetical protein|tara:strand:+ start:524 stop:691 length:168 start_codon:yes stop_codon:yes gene_type:complete